MLLILLLHAPVTPLLPPLNGLLVHIFWPALRLPAYKRVNRFRPLTILPTKYKYVFSSLHAFFISSVAYTCHVFNQRQVYADLFVFVTYICRTLNSGIYMSEYYFCDIYLSYFKHQHMFARFIKCHIHDKEFFYNIKFIKTQK